MRPKELEAMGWALLCLGLYMFVVGVAKGEAERAQRRAVLSADAHMGRHEREFHMPRPTRTEPQASED